MFGNRKAGYMAVAATTAALVALTVATPAASASGWYGSRHYSRYRPAPVTTTTVQPTTTTVKPTTTTVPSTTTVKPTTTTVKPTTTTAPPTTVPMSTATVTANSKGFGMSMPVFESKSSSEQKAQLADLKALGITWIRIDVDWWLVQESDAKTYNWSYYDTTLANIEAAGIKVDGTIVTTPPWARPSDCTDDGRCRPASVAAYATFAKAVAQRYGTRFAALEIWNEPNINLAIPADYYTSMLKQASAAIRSVNPNIAVISGGLAPACTCGDDIAPIDYTTRMYKAGAKGSFDALGHHPYSYPAPPSDFQSWSGWSQMSSTSPSVRSVMDSYGDTNVPIWMTEVGAPTNGPGVMATCSDYRYDVHPDHVDSCLQSKIFTEVIASAKSTSWAGVTFLYTYKDRSATDTSTNENFFGVVTADGTHKASYDAIKAAIAK
jgi:polysaccharide biosynthesis protein PslG